MKYIGRNSHMYMRRQILDCTILSLRSCEPTVKLQAIKVRAWPNDQEEPEGMLAWIGNQRGIGFQPGAIMRLSVGLASLGETMKPAIGKTRPARGRRQAAFLRRSAWVSNRL